MITINLRPGQRRKRAGSPLAGVVDRLKAAGAKVREPMLLAAIVAWVVVIGGLGYVWLSNASELGALEPQLEQARSENRRFKTFIQQKRRQELIRDSLVSQIATIRSVDGDRYVWSHVMDEVARALPAYTWLIDLGITAAVPTTAQAAAADTTAASDSVATPPVQFQVTGRTVDIQAYTKFLRQLEASPWISEVTPVSAATVIENERAVTAFTIRATVRKADSAYIRTVPLSQSAR
jgi:Tfp pilus assembly protein PilN